MISNKNIYYNQLITYFHKMHLYILAYYISTNLKNLIHENMLWLSLLMTYHLNCKPSLKKHHIYHLLNF